MTNVDLINSETLNFPFNRNGKDFYSCVCKLFDEFLVLVNKFDGEFEKNLSKNFKIIEEEISLIKEALELYNIGKISLSYQKIKDCLDLLKSHDLLEVGAINGDFYRIRTGNNVNYSKKDLFHIPFQVREKVATQRYSIPGLPCIYMADSLYTAWEEMNRPDFNLIHVSRFSFMDSDIRLLYLNTTIQDIRMRCVIGNKINNENILIKYFSSWPLLATCSFKVDKVAETFKPEYIISQMVLQWITELGDIDGIQFKSNRINYNSSNVGSFNNVAIPIKSSKEIGYCDYLVDKVQLTEPLSWSLLDISEPDTSKVKKKQGDMEVKSIRVASYVELIKGQKSDYFSTKFGLMESKLKELPIGILTNA